jgi:hypothetical protein
MIVNLMPQFGATLMVINYAPIVISYAPNIFTIQTRLYRLIVEKQNIRRLVLLIFLW